MSSRLLGSVIVLLLTVRVASGQWTTCTGTTSQTCTTANVGIGTTNATSRLTVSGGPMVLTIPTTGTLMYMAANGGASTVMSLSDTTLTSFANIDLRDGGGGARIYLPAYVGNVYFNQIGNVGIGTTTPSYKLHVIGNAYATGSIYTGGDVIAGADTVPILLRGVANGGAIQIKANSATTDRYLRLGQVDNNGVFYPYMHMSDGGNVGIGTLTPGTPLDVYNSGNALIRARGGYAGLLLTSGNGTTSTRFSFIDMTSSETQPAVWRVGMNGTQDFTITDFLPPYPNRLTLTRAGELTVNGNINATGVINAKYQDVAEWVSATAPMPSGTVAIIDPDADDGVVPSSRAYDTRVAGVVSAQPGLLLGVAGNSKEKIATAGRVKVRVDATCAPIRRGDLLVSSDKPGMAMKSEPLIVAGVQMHRPGTVIGKALEPLASGDGEILVLLSLQ